MFKIKLANLIIEINNKFKQVEFYCKNYAVFEDTQPDISVCISDEEISEECGRYPVAPSPSYAECICVYRNICKALPSFDAFLLHSSVVEYCGYAYAFAASSGTGKTTHTMLWLKHFGENARIINGDKPILRFTDEDLLAFGTPWCGKEGFNINTSAPLAAICFIERDEINSIRPLSPAEALPRLFNQLLVPDTAEALDPLAELINRLLLKIPCFLLKCNISFEAVDIAYNTMNPLISNKLTFTKEGITQNETK